MRNFNKENLKGVDDMGDISSEQIMDILKKGAISLLYIIGLALMAYNFIAFKTDKFGIYYVDDNQMWFAIGAATVATGWVVRNWRKI